MFSSDKNWREYTFVGFDTETAGKYPLASDVCEMAAVKWRDGQILETFETLLKPREPMGDEVIGIHGITNEMVANAPLIAERIGAFRDFIQGCVPIAHHAPFDLGFLAVDMEDSNLPLPVEPVICSSLLSRAVIPESGNHRLQTLVKFLEIDGGTAHRALDDAKACLQVAVRCMERLGDVSLSEVFQRQGGPLFWQRYSMKAVGETDTGSALLFAIRNQRPVSLAYSGGSRPGKERRVVPIGIVRNPDGDFLAAIDESDERAKRYLLEKILSVKTF